MSPLRQKLLDDLKLSGYSDKTIEAYSRTVLTLAKHYNRSPHLLSEDELRGFFLYLKQERKISQSSFRQYITGIRFFYEKTLGREWKIFDLLHPGKSRKLPFAISHQEVLYLLSKIQLDDCRMALTTIYACGLRLSEALHLTISQIDGKRGSLLVLGGKGKKDRYVPLPSRLLFLLRRYWLKKRPHWYLFPSSRDPEVPMHCSRLQKVFKTVVRQSGTAHQQTSIHTLRHSYATYLLENGVNLKQLKELLGHRSSVTTMRYTHLTPIHFPDVSKKINQLMSDI